MASQCSSWIVADQDGASAFHCLLQVLQVFSHRQLSTDIIDLLEASVDVYQTRNRMCSIYNSNSSSSPSYQFRGKGSPSLSTSSFNFSPSQQQQQQQLVQAPSVVEIGTLVFVVLLQHQLLFPDPKVDLLRDCGLSSAHLEKASINSILDTIRILLKGKKSGLTSSLIQAVFDGLATTGI